MTIDEMIAVLEAYKRGEKIEYYSDVYEDWKLVENPGWNFGNISFHIAKPAPKKVKMCCWRLDANELHWLNGYYPAPDHWIRVPSEDKEIELP